MIYTYRHLPPNIEGFHSEIIYFFEHLLHRNLAAYDENVLSRHDFIALVNGSQERLKGNLKKITEAYFHLSTKDKNTLKKAFRNNCDISATCKDNRKHLVKYDELKSLFKAFKRLFNYAVGGLPSKSIINR